MLKILTMFIIWFENDITRKINVRQLLDPESGAFVSQQRILCIESFEKLLSVLCVNENSYQWYQGRRNWVLSQSLLKYPSNFHT